MSPKPSSRIVVCSDIHGNLPALKTFLNEVDKKGCNRIYCCGDVVGYGAHPNECCEILQERDIPTVMGNHDQAAVYLSLIDFFNDIAREAILWTHRMLSSTNMDYLKRLPYVIQEEDLTFVHASPRRPEDWGYVLTLGEAKECFDYFDNWICFIGHSHQPFIVELSEGKAQAIEEPQVKLSRKKRYLVNVGSIGQPRDRMPQLSYVSLDPKNNTLTFHRTPYPVKEAQRAIEEAGLPEELADRLSHGW